MTPPNHHGSDRPLTAYDVERMEDRLSRAIREGIGEVKNKIDESEEGWRKRTHELSNIVGEHDIQLALHAQKFRDQADASAAFWTRISIIIPLLGAAGAWLMDKFNHLPPHLPGAK
jgi:hypothetical protein